MATRATSDSTENSASIGRLVASVKDDLSGLLRDEIELAKTELREDAKATAVGGVLAAVGAALGLLALLFGSFALVYGVHALGLALGWSYLVVAGFYLLVAVVLFLVAKSRFGRVTKAERTKITARDAAAALRPAPTDRT